MTTLYRGDHQAGEIELLEEIVVFQNQFLTLYNDKVRFPDGSLGRYLRKRSGGADYGVCVMPVDERGNLLLIRQFRHQTRQWMWEVPKGFGEHYLSALECAKKELKEETGYQSEDWEHVFTWRGETVKGTYLFRVVLDPEKRGEQQLEASEAISDVTWFTPQMLRELLDSGEMMDEETTFCAMHCLHHAAVKWH